MKYLKIIIFAVSLSIPYIAMAQAIHCPIPCGNESFPYYFCSVSGAKLIHCSRNPNEGDGGIPWKSIMPGCVNVTPIDPSMMFQPAGEIPAFTETPPDRQTIFDDYVSSGYQLPPWEYPTYNEDSDEWSDDSSAYAVAWQQWDIDSEFFLAGIPQESAYVDDSDGHQLSVYFNYYNHDKQRLFDLYDDEDSTYIDDSTSHALGGDVPYFIAWDNTQANSDAQSDLNAWLGICSLHGDTSCCISIKPDTNVLHWKGNYQHSTGTGTDTLAYAVGLTYIQGNCPDGACPNPNYRYVTYNATNNFYYENNSDVSILQPEYILHPHVPLQDWFTGTSQDTGAINQGYSGFSFSEVAEHEIGHWLALLHPDAATSDGTVCVNNWTECRHAIPNYWMLMGANQAKPNIPSRGLGADDSCMFAKLYCADAADTTLGVSVPQAPDWFNPEVFPNPSSGGMTLTFGVEDRSFVQVVIYDALGNQVKDVSSDYEGPGARSISLGTESLPSGNYVCRVRVDDRVRYINLAIVK